MLNKRLYIIYFSLAFAVIVFASVVYFASGGIDGFVYSQQSKNYFEQKQFDVFVCGCVENEGYLTLTHGQTYAILYEEAGLLDCSHIVTDFDLPVDVQTSVVKIDYHNGTEVLPVANVNDENFIILAQKLDIDFEIVRKIIDYKSIYGKIQSKQHLKDILGETLYLKVHYKVYVEK